MEILQAKSEVMIDVNNHILTLGRPTYYIRLFDWPIMKEEPGEICNMSYIRPLTELVI